MFVRSSVSGRFDAEGVHRFVDGLATRAVEAGALIGGETATARARQRRKSGHMAAIVVEQARRTHRGIAAAFRSPAYHAWYQSLGTLGNRKARLRDPPSTTRSRAPGTGVVALNFLHAGKDAGRAAMMHLLGGRA